MKTLSRFLIALIVFVGLANATEIDVLISNFYKHAKKNEIMKVKHLQSIDRDYMRAIDALTNPDSMYKTKLSVGDPESKTKRKTKEISLPNYPKAQKYFKKSVDKYSNPLSAYIGLYIYKTKIPAIGVKELKYKRKYIELTYKYSNSCLAYINYADMLIDGVAGPVDLVKAGKVLTDSRACLRTASSWEKQVIEMKKAKLRMKLGK